MYVRVAVDTEGAAYLDSFTYEVPEALQSRVKIGACVLVPFGSTQTIGCIVALEDTPSVARTKAILAVLDSPITLSEELVDLAGWLSERFICGLSRCTHSILPGVIQCKVKGLVELADDAALPSSPLTAALVNAGGSIPLDTLRSKRPELFRELKKFEIAGGAVRRYELIPPQGKERRIAAAALSIPAEQVEEEAGKLQSRAPRQAEVLKHIALYGTTPCARLVSELSVSESVISGLVSKGLLKRMSLLERRTPAHTSVPSTAHYRLTEEQQAALTASIEGIDRREHSVMLLHGVTASGKTEVYLRAIEHAAKQGRRSLVLLPEISLTTQVLNIFRGRFGSRVAVLHSMLSAGERFDEWVRTENNEVDVVLGARSAVFAPIKNLGLVIIDEEHEPSYKQDSDPRYHCRDTALRRAEQNGALAVLGSATPSIESYYRAKTGKYRLVVMRERIANRPLPSISIADLREEYQKGHVTIFSEKLAEAIGGKLGKGQQVILFQNRRAYATFLLCRECGYTAGCPNCAVALKLHAAEHIMRCHHCDYEEEAPTLCPNCGSRKVGKFGIGTERIEEETRSAFPDARVLRMDRDTTARKGSHAQILDAFRKHDADILVGTQMIAKGLDFPGVTLVGVISADTSLNLPDFRAGERTFQLLSQVAGRAGRGTEPGEVIIQTFNPEHYAVVAAAAHDYESFYEQEIELRRETGYPPFSSMLNIVSSDESEADARQRLDELVRDLAERSKTTTKASVEVLGPVPAPVARLRGRYRWHVLLRSPDRDALAKVVRESLDALPSIRRGVTVDIDPASML
ncbi:MAG: primosomal protein N' [Armatimonadota bacterium]